MDSATFKRFNTAIDTVFENSEEMDMSVEPGRFRYENDCIVLMRLFLEGSLLSHERLLFQIPY